MTQRESAQQGIVTDEMREAARADGVPPEIIRDGIAAGTIVVCHNRIRQNGRPLAVGSGLRTKINANIGTSADDLDIVKELETDLGHPVPAGTIIELGWIRQKGGKTVYAWAVEGDIDPATMSSNTIEFEWPPFSGKRKSFPEVDKWVYYGPEDARAHIKETQRPLLDRLDEALASAPKGDPAAGDPR